MIKKPVNLNKTTIVSKKNLNLSTDIKTNSTITKDISITKNENDKSLKLSEKNLTPVKKKQDYGIVREVE